MKTVLISVLAAFVVGTALLLGTGADPLVAYQAIVSGAFGPDGFADTLA